MKRRVDRLHAGSSILTASNGYVSPMGQGNQISKGMVQPTFTPATLSVWGGTFVYNSPCINLLTYLVWRQLLRPMTPVNQHHVKADLPWHWWIYRIRIRWTQFTHLSEL